MRSLVVPLVLLTLVPLVSAGPPPSNCNVYTHFSVSVGAFHLYIPTSNPIPFATYPELWQESNGIDGLQRGSSWCTGGPSIPADTCITHSVTFQAVNCVLRYPGPL